jgi:hypothetical protein
LPQGPDISEKMLQINLLARYYIIIFAARAEDRISDNQVVLFPTFIFKEPSCKGKIDAVGTH